MEWTRGLTWTCRADEAGERVDRFLQARLPGLSRAAVQKWIEEGRFLLGGRPFKKNAVLAEGDAVTLVRPPEPEPAGLEPEAMPLDILHEDDDIIVIDKPKGLVCHPGHGVRRGTLVQGLLHHCGSLSSMGAPVRPGLVHRLDKDTTGLLVAAKNDAAHLALARQMQERRIRRVYRALAWRELQEASGTIDLPVGRNPRDPLRMAVAPGGRPAVTHFLVLDNGEVATHLEIRLDTGRTHQIRVHLSHSGHPVVGDPLYGGGREYPGKVPPLLRPAAARLLKLFPTQALHAAELAFLHPGTGRELSFASPPPPQMEEAVALLRGLAAKRAL